MTEIGLQFCSVVVLMIRRLGYRKKFFFFHHLSFGSSAHLALGKEMEQLDRLYRTMDSVALVWHDQEYVCLNISVERVAVQKMSTLCHLKIGYWLKVCFITDRFRC